MMQVTTYYVTQRIAAGFNDADAAALINLINDVGAGNGDNRSWNAMRAQVDAALDTDTQRRLGVFIEPLVSEADDD
jgi:hypothetical protein